MATMSDVLKCEEGRRHIVNISGGKDSAALALHMRRKYPQINAEYVFCDTGAEIRETYDYLNRLEDLLGKEIITINALDQMGIQKKLNRSPFDVVLKEIYGGFLPGPQARWCTRKLKIKPFEWYVGKDQAYSYIGIRADENRKGYQSRRPPVFSTKPNIIPVYPFKDDGLILSDIKLILEESGLGMPEYYQWRSRSGCFFCFYQQIGEWKRLKEHHPDLFEKAKEYEAGRDGNKYTWVQGMTLDEIADLEGAYPLPDMDETESCAICHL